MVSGENLTDAQATYQDAQPVVSFKFNSIGARRFCDATKNNVGKPFAIVLDNKVISAPVIRDAICGGAGVISGNFTIQSAQDLALLLRAGALPAPLKIIEERPSAPISAPIPSAPASMPRPSASPWSRLTWCWLTASSASSPISR